MKVSQYTQNDLRTIALGLLSEEIYCDWTLENDSDVPEVFQQLYLSEIDSLILQTQDIGMLYENMRECSVDENGQPIFSTFNTLTKEEALEVARLFLVYSTLEKADGHIDIPHI